MTDIISATHPIFVLGTHLKDTPAHILAHYEARLLRYFEMADARLARNRYLAGQEICVADFALYPTAHFRRPLIERSNSTPHLERWLAEVGDRPGVTRGMAVPADE
nr:glutathione binding-like protein [Microvirga antarctica]